MNEREAYEALTYKWQDARQIRDRILLNRDVILSPGIPKIGTARIYLTLDSLVKKGFAETRERDLTEKERESGKNELMREYRRSSSKSPQYHSQEISDKNLYAARGFG